jgi:hypothetical protein
MQPGEWMNYTRTFPAGCYSAYLRVSSSAARQLRLDGVNGDRTTTSQTTSAQGTFRVPNTGGPTFYQYVPLTDAFGNPAVVNLSGVQTLRLTSIDANNDVQPNFIVLAPAVSSLPPSVSSISPAPGATGVAVEAAVSVNVANGCTTVQTTRLFFDGSDVTADATIASTTAGESITYVPPKLFQTSSVHTVRLVLRDNAGSPNTISNQWSFTVGAGVKPATQVLFVVANPAALNAADTAVRDRLQNVLGKTVTVVAALGIAASAADGKDLIVISSTVSSGDVGNTFQTTPVPVLSWEQALQDNFNETLDTATDHGGAAATDQINIISTSHPLAAGFPLGPLTISAGTFGFSWGLPNANAVSVATVVGTPGQVVLYGYETGASLMNGQTAPARRMNFPGDDNSFASLNANGLKLFDAAVAWAGVGTVNIIAPTVSRQPQSRSVSCGASVSFVVCIRGTGPLSYQWFKGATPITDATNDTLTLNNVQLAAAGNYHASVTNSAGATSSQDATLTVTDPVVATLGIAQAGTNVVITWPASCTPYTLEGTPVLPAVTWNSFAYGGPIGGNFQATIPIGSSNTFFRLRYP